MFFFSLAIFCIFQPEKYGFEHIQSSCYEKNKNEKGTFLSYIPCSFGGGGGSPNLKENVSREKYSSHLHLDFRGEGIFLIRFLHFEQVLQSCHHLMIMPSWNARI